MQLVTTHLCQKANLLFKKFSLVLFIRKLALWIIHSFINELMEHSKVMQLLNDVLLFYKAHQISNLKWMCAFACTLN